MKNIVILGGGFGGVYAAHHLLKKLNNKVNVTVINKRNYFTFTPLLHEVASGLQNRQNVIESIRSLLHHKNFRFVEGEIKRVDYKKKIVEANNCKVKYDYLIIAIGSKTNYYNIQGAEKNALVLKTINDASYLRCRTIQHMEMASKYKDTRYLRYVICGAGPTGIETAAELQEFIHENLLKNYPTLGADEFEIIVVQKGDKIVPLLSDKLRKKVMKRLKKKGIKVKLNSRVTKVTENGVEINKKEFLKSKFVLWTAGVTPNVIPKEYPKLSNATNHFEVDEYLETKQKGVYAIGDCALFFNAGENMPIPKLAQVATEQAEAVAYNIYADLHNKKRRSFKFKMKGFLMSVGRWYAVAQVGGIYFSGFFAWWFWRTVYLFKTLGFWNKVRIAIDWTIDFFADRDSTEM